MSPDPFDPEFKSIAANLRPLSEQERQLREKLQLLARTENARLESALDQSTTSANSNVAFASPPRRTSSLKDKRRSANISASRKKSGFTHHRHYSLQPYFNSNNKVPDLPPLSPLQTQFQPIAKDNARAMAYAQLAGTDSVESSSAEVSATVPPVTPITILPVSRSRRSSLVSPSFVMSPSDIASLGTPLCESESNSSPSLSLKDDDDDNDNDLDGVDGMSESTTSTALSPPLSSGAAEELNKKTKPTLEMITNTNEDPVSPSSSSSLASGSTTGLQFKELIKMAIASPGEVGTQSPAEIAETIRHNVAKVSPTALVARAVSLLGRSALAGTAFVIVLIQVSLLSVMVTAYLFGDLLLFPFNSLRASLPGLGIGQPMEEEQTEEEKEKMQILKMQKAARKAVQKRAKRRVRH